MEQFPLKHKVCKWSVGYLYKPDEKLLHFLGCKRRHCEDCGWYWAAKWRTLLYHKHGQDIAKGIKITRAISLTTAYDAGYQAIWLALKYFWRDMRKTFPAMQYWGVVEYNQKHTQPHIHFILDKDDYIKDGFNFIQEIWLKAQKQAHFKKLAWNVSIGQVKGDIEKYFTKYLTKLTGGKDEIPKPENWQGRYVRYSRNFFGRGISTKDILQALLVKKSLTNSDFFARSYVEIFPKWGIHSAMGQGIFIEAANRQEKLAVENDNRIVTILDNYGVIEDLGFLEFIQTSF